MAMSRALTARRVANLEADWEGGQARARVPSDGQLHEQGAERPASGALLSRKTISITDRVELQLVSVFPAISVTVK